MQFHVKFKEISAEIKERKVSTFKKMLYVIV
jgi:hypothetical protein